MTAAAAGAAAARLARRAEPPLTFTAAASTQQVHARRAQAAGTWAPAHSSPGAALLLHPTPNLAAAPGAKVGRPSYSSDEPYSPAIRPGAHSSQDAEIVRLPCALPTSSRPCPGQIRDTPRLVAGECGVRGLAPGAGCRARSFQQETARATWLPT